MQKKNRLQENYFGRLRYRASHRGIREMDIIFGKFVDRFSQSLNMKELAELENLLEQNDQDLLQWFIGLQLPPKKFDTDLFRRIRLHANKISHELIR